MSNLLWLVSSLAVEFPDQPSVGLLGNLLLGQVRVPLDDGFQPVVEHDGGGGVVAGFDEEVA
jgi:hypothetical protein